MDVNAGALRLLLLLFLATPVGVAAYMFWLAWTRGGDPQQASITVQYEPPNGFTPAECGTLVDNAVALRDITATITDLSVRGYLSIEQTEVSGPSGKSFTDYLFHLSKPLNELTGLKPHETEVMNSIFMPANPLLMLSQAMQSLEQARASGRNPYGVASEMLGATLSRVEARAKEASDEYRAISGGGDAIPESVKMSDLQEAFFLQRVPRIRDAVFNCLAADGYYATRPDRIRIHYAVAGVLLALAMAGIGAFLASLAKMNMVAIAGSGLLSGVIVLGFGFFMPARTANGAHALGRVLGFREFLSRVEKDHIERLEKTPELFEKYLPYAMALGVENRWTQAFGNITVQPPRWFVSRHPGGFLPMHLTDSLNQLSDQRTR